MTKNHFEAAAKQIRESNYKRDIKFILALSYVDFFRPFNPKFDAQRFLDACEV